MPPSKAPHPLPIADFDDAGAELVFEGGQPLLSGTECRACGARSFLARKACFDCGKSELRSTRLASAGTLYSFSTVHVSSSRPTPYSIGYVDLDDGVRVLATLTAAPGELAIDQRVKLVADGEGWAFAPENRS